MNKTRGFGVIFLVLMTQGCNPFMPFRPNSEQLVTKGWAKQPVSQEDPEPLYCYRTLAQNVCYTAPLDDQSRLSAYYGPKP